MYWLAVTENVGVGGWGVGLVENKKVPLCNRHGQPSGHNSGLPGYFDGRGTLPSMASSDFTNTALHNSIFIPSNYCMDLEAQILLTITWSVNSTVEAVCQSLMPNVNGNKTKFQTDF